MDKTHLTAPPVGIHWKPVDELTFSDDFIFKVHCEQGRAMRLPAWLLAYCEQGSSVRLLALLLEHGVRFDLLARGTGTLVNMEMQVLNTKGLSERSLYYLSSLVLSSLDKGEPYEKLGRSIVIFFCKFDPFDKGRAVYEFSMRAATPRGLRLTDKASIFFYNAAMWQKVRGKAKQGLFCYIMTGDVLRGGSCGSLAGQLDDAVADVKRNDKANGGSTMLYETVMGWMAQSEQRGIAIGEKQGIAIGVREKAVQTARNLLLMGLGEDQIARATGLSVEEVASLL